MLLNFLLNLKNGPIEESLLILLFSVVAVFLAFPIHEFAHGFTSFLLGDKTAKYQGRLTLNPLVHLDLYGFLSLVILGFGWARPVQFDPVQLGRVQGLPPSCTRVARHPYKKR